MEHECRRFLLHSQNHTMLLVDITEVGLPTEIYPKGGKEQTVPLLRFQTKSDAEEYLHGLGADAETLETVSRRLAQTGAAYLAITYDRWKGVFRSSAG